ncbi:MAG: N-acetylmuramoyl-L-alanine amidase [Methylococcaceae bacterium]|nr:N-acetylmuramoyl-L-alanine amidase [Methylococcaceae bacterium]
MLKQWIGCSPENFTEGRKGLKPDAVVVHGFDDLATTRALFSDPKSNQSCHYVAAADGTVHQYVDEADTAYHAGLVINPSWRLLRQGVNPNLHTLGVAAAVSPDVPWPDGLYETVAQLIRDLASQWGFDPDSDHIVLHSEIRASKNCTGKGFNRKTLLDRITEIAPSPAVRTIAAQTVQLLSKANLRDGAPTVRSRIVRTLAAGSTLEVDAYTDRGDRVSGNSLWYRTANNGYLWSGATDRPNPVDGEPVPDPDQTPPAPQDTVRSPVPVEAASSPVPFTGPSAISVASEIGRIDELLSQPGALPIGASEPDTAAVGAIQDLLSGHGYNGLPSILASIYGHFGSKTGSAIKDFQDKHGLPTSGQVDAATLKSLIEVTADKPRISQAYLTLVLQIPYRGLEKILSITAQMEGVGKFGALNLNTDGAGLSYGIIQWAQKPGRLAELVRAFALANRNLYVKIFAEGDPSLADALILHLEKPHGGVNASNGTTLNPGFNLIAPPWTQRFEAATRERAFQKVQVTIAAQAFRQSLRKIQGYAPDIRSERGVAFMLDVANQFGDGGLKRIYTKIHRSGMTEMEIIDAIADETVEEIADRFKQGVRSRRDGFLHTRLLADQPITLEQSA